MISALLAGDALDKPPPVTFRGIHTPEGCHVCWHSKRTQTQTHLSRAFSFLEIGMSLNERDVDVLARTIWGEARGEGRAGQIAVGWAIRNRVEMDLHGDGKPDWWGEGYVGVCQAKWQFSCWNRNDPNYPYLSGARQIPGAQYTLARECAIAVMEGREPDPTGGATHYYATTMPKPPAWAANATRTCKVQRHIFYTDVP